MKRRKGYELRKESLLSRAEGPLRITAALAATFMGMIGINEAIDGHGYDEHVRYCGNRASTSTNLGDIATRDVSDTSYDRSTDPGFIVDVYSTLLSTGQVERVPDAQNLFFANNDVADKIGEITCYELNDGIRTVRFTQTGSQVQDQVLEALG